MYLTQYTSTALTFFAFLVPCQGSSILARDVSYETDAALALAAVRRGLPNAPNGYTPQAGDCPSNRPVIRSASSISPNETSWLYTRRNNTVGAMRDLLGRLNISNFDAQTYINNNAKNATALPNIGVAISGGGYRALMNAAGAVAAFDDRTNNSTSSGHLGGLLQATTYLTGLSGGSWLVGSLFTNNFTTVPALLDDNTSTVWEFGDSIFTGPAEHGIQTLSKVEYFNHIYDQVKAKANAGFNTSITDYWGRALSFQLINATEGGPAYTWSSIALQPDFTNGNWPMPILVADGRAPGEKVISGNATVYEFNPWEFGTWDPTTYGFVPTEYLGSNFSDGVLPNNEKCVRGFDNAGYVMGTSSTLFNQFLLRLNGTTSVPTLLKDVIAKFLGAVSNDNDDIATYTPNPFYHYHNATSKTAETRSLFLVDGGEDLQNIPLHPLIQPDRAVDVIFAIDSSADTKYGWPNGTSLVATYERSINSSGIQNGTTFPHIPDTNTFVNLGLNTRPTFFGCDAANMSGPAPLIVYIPNAPYVYNSNVSTFDPAYNNSERNAIVQNGYDVATRANATVDAMWPTCVGCAILSRSLDRTHATVPDVCHQCFQMYCWAGNLNSTAPVEYQPKISLTPINVQSGAGRVEFGGGLGLVVGVLGIISVLLL